MIQESMDQPLNVHHYKPHYDLIQLVAAEQLFMITYQNLKWNPETIWEIGCRSGCLTKFMTCYYPLSGYIATDLTEEALQYCQNKIPYPVHYLLQDAHDHVTDKVDVVVSSLGLPWFDDFETMLMTAWESATDLIALSVPVQGSLRSWDTFLTRNRIPYKPQPFMPLKQVVKRVKRLQAPTMFVHMETIRQRFSRMDKLVVHLESICPYQSLVNNVDTAALLAMPDQNIEIEYQVLYICCSAKS